MADPGETEIRKGGRPEAMTVTESVTLKHVVDLGEREAGKVIADIEELLRTAKAAAARGVKTLVVDIEHELKPSLLFSSSGFPLTDGGTVSTPVRVAVTGTKQDVAADPAPETAAPTEPPAATDLPGEAATSDTSA